MAWQWPNCFDDNHLHFKMLQTETELARNSTTTTTKRIENGLCLRFNRRALLAADTKSDISSPTKLIHSINGIVQIALSASVSLFANNNKKKQMAVHIVNFIDITV